MESRKPNIYLHKEFHFRDGFEYEQPYDYCGGLRINLKQLMNFKALFGVIFSEAKKESNYYNNAITYSRYNSKLWTNKSSMDAAFLKIHEFNIKGGSGSGSSVTPLFPFEIFMMNDGFEMISFCELTRINPGISIVGDSMVGDKIINPKGIVRTRFYHKDGLCVYLGCGIKTGDYQTSFYFETNKSNAIFQIDNDINNYNKAIKGELKNIAEHKSTL